MSTIYLKKTKEKSLFQISHQIFKVLLSWSEFRAGDQKKVLPSNRLTCLCSITITRLSFSETAQNRWELFNVFFNEQLNLPSDQICLPFCNVSFALLSFNTVCNPLETNFKVWDHKLFSVLCLILHRGNKCHKEIPITN